jgi:hypothetical protein
MRPRFYPACYNTTVNAGYDAILSVAYITKEGLKSINSSFGATTVDLGAPGAAIYSTIPGSSYGSKSGTSMAAPTLPERLPSMPRPSRRDGAQARADLLTYGVVPTPSLAGITVTGGRLDVSAFLSAPATEVATPSNSRECAGGGHFRRQG